MSIMTIMTVIRHRFFFVRVFLLALLREFVVYGLAWCIFAGRFDLSLSL